MERSPLSDPAPLFAQGNALTKQARLEKANLLPVYNEIALNSMASIYVSTMYQLAIKYQQDGKFDREK